MVVVGVEAGVEVARLSEVRIGAPLLETHRPQLLCEELRSVYFEC